jgi:hypothetical protein
MERLIAVFVILMVAWRPLRTAWSWRFAFAFPDVALKLRERPGSDWKPDLYVAHHEFACGFHLATPANGKLEFAPTRHWAPGAGYRVHLTPRQVTKLDASK